MCLAMNADVLKPGERCASTSNRNFEGVREPEVAPIWCRPPWQSPRPLKVTLSISVTGDELFRPLESNIHLSS